MKLSHAQLSFNPIGTPQSDAFGDVYYSNKDGLAESDYVFIQGNRLIKKWQSWQDTHFCIGETGFGTGLNFLITIKHFDAFLKAYPQSPLKHLHYISVEKYPIEASALATIYQNWPSLADYSASVLRQYPPALEGIHRSMHKVGAVTEVVTLDLILGDAFIGLSNIHVATAGRVNAWYLDGFAPSKNESMWEQNVFDHMARLSAPQASLATFTAAGVVQRGLQAAGFEVSKLKGFGRKREMIVAQLATQHQSPPADNQPPYFQRAKHSAGSRPKSVAIVGAGIAGALLALRLTMQGIEVKLICKDKGPAFGASGNPIAGFYPQLNAEAGTSSQFFVHAFLYARRFYDNLLEQGMCFEHDWCSVLQLGFNKNTQDRLIKMAEKSLWPEQLAKVVDAEQATIIAGVDIKHPALHLAAAGWIDPVSLIHACLQKAQATGLLSTHYQRQMLCYDASQTGVIVSVTDLHACTQKIHADALIIAAGADSGKLTQQFLPMRLTRGQVEAIPAGKATRKLSAVLCHKGYFTPAVNGQHALGSTYVKDDLNTEHRLSETASNINMHSQAVQESAWMNEIEQLDISKVQGRAAIRASTPDHLPMVGAMPNIAVQTMELADLYKAMPCNRYPSPSNIDNVFLLTGLGSRGVTSAPILVDTLIAEMLHQPFPLSASLLDALSPNRFLVRALIRQSIYQEGG